MADKKNVIGKKKVNHYTEGECDAVILRLEAGKQDNTSYYQQVVEQRAKLMAGASERAKRIREMSKGKLPENEQLKLIAQVRQPAKVVGLTSYDPDLGFNA